MLPFVKAPAPRTTRQIGNDVCGVIEMEVRGGLTVTETNMIAELQAQQESSLVAGAKLAESIAADESITISEAFQIIENTISNKALEPDAKAIQLRHMDRINDIVQIFRTSNQHAAEATVTALIRTRCDRPLWSPVDTLTLDQALFNGIWELALDEQTTEDMPSSPPTEDDLKKPQPDSEKAPKRTGAKSSGN